MIPKSYASPRCPEDCSGCEHDGICSDSLESPISNQIGNDGTTYPPMSEEKKAELVDVMNQIKKQPTIQARLRDALDFDGWEVRKEAADRIDELEKEPNLLNVAWLQGEFSELQAKVEVLLNEHAERGVRIEELETTIRKMAMTSLSVEGQWSDKVDDLKARVIYLTRTLQYERENPVFTGKCDTWQMACGIARGKVVELEQQIEAKQARIDKLEGAIERMRVAGGSVEFQGALELAKDLLCRNASS